MVTMLSVSHKQGRIRHCADVLARETFIWPLPVVWSGLVWWKIVVGNNNTLPEKSDTLLRASGYHSAACIFRAETRTIFLTPQLGIPGIWNNCLHVYNLKEEPRNGPNKWSLKRKERVKEREETWNEEHIFSCTAVEGVGVGSGSKTNTLWSRCVHTCACATVIWSV